MRALGEITPYDQTGLVLVIKEASDEKSHRDLWLTLLVSFDWHSHLRRRANHRQSWSRPTM